MSWEVWGLLAFALSLGLTMLCKPIAVRAGAVATPRVDRWHTRTVPMLGGVAMALTVGLLVLASAGGSFRVLVLLGGGLCLFGVGLVDDLRALKPQTKFLSQILVASAVIALGLRLELTPFPLLNVLISLFWIVGITNAFNLLDNMDGLAAGIAIITAAFRLAFFLLDRDPINATVTAIFIGAVAGFLVYNFHPASIFMGDAGSLFIGFFVAVLALSGGYPYSRSVVSVLLFPVLILLVPIFDTAFVTLTRQFANRPVSVGGRDHTSHRLVALGLSEREAVLLLYAAAFASGALAYAVYRYGLSYNIVLLALLALAVGILGIFLGRVKVYAEDEAPESAGRLVRLVADFSYKRQVGTICIDLMLIVLAYYSAYLLRFENQFPVYADLFNQSLPIVIGCQMAALASFRTYQGIWRYTSLQDLIRLAKATMVGSAATILLVVWVYRFNGFSRAVFVIDWVLLLLFVSGSRVSFRTLSELFRSPNGDARRVLIYGAGDGGELALREMLNNAALGRTPIGFLDDDRSKQRTQIRGYPVLAGLDGLSDAIALHRISEVVIASNRILPERLEALEAICEQLNVPLVRASVRWEPATPMSPRSWNG